MSSFSVAQQRRNSTAKWFVVQTGGPGEGFEVQKYGDGRVALIGFPSVGKSTLLSQLTGTESEAAAYEFTTLTCIPGIIHYKGTKIQLLDLPGIIEGAAQGKGRGRQVCAVSGGSSLSSAHCNTLIQLIAILSAYLDTLSLIGSRDLYVDEEHSSSIAGMSRPSG